MGEKGPLTRESAAGWLVNHQHDRVLGRYADIDRGAKLRRLFSEYVYPTWDKREDYKFRCEFFIKIFTGQTVRAMAPFRPLFHRQIEQIEQMDSLEDYINMIMDLYALSMELDERMVGYFCENCGSIQELNDAAYRAAFRACSTFEERRRQTDMVLALAEYARRTVERGGYIDVLVRTFPTIPIFRKNRLVRGANEMIRMAKTAYYAAKSHRADLAEFIEIIREREYAFIDSMMDGDD